MSFLVARPLSKAILTQDALIAAGFSANIAPVLKIEISHSDALTTCFNDSQPEVIVITSTYAVEWLTKQVLTYPLDQVNIVCIGKSSANFFEQQIAFKTPVKSLVIPAQENSEGALGLPILQNVKGKNVLILKGDGGRTLLPNTLQKRGANLTELCVYKRCLNKQADFNNDYKPSNIQCIIVTSVEIAQAIFSIYDLHYLQNLTWMVASKRIKDYAIQQGVISIIESQGASQHAIVACAAHLVNTGVVND